MRLARLASLTFRPTPTDQRRRTMVFGNVEVGTFNVREFQGALNVIVVSTVTLKVFPDTDAEGWIIIPDVARRDTERGIQLYADLLAVMHRAVHRVSSPTPYVALVTESAEERAWFAQTSGIRLSPAGQATIEPQIEWNEATLRAVTDRPDGLALLAESYTHSNQSGRFLEYIRVFERAFKLHQSGLVTPLAEFLSQTPMGYTKAEVRRWIDRVRGPSAHARGHFLLEADVRPFVHRAEQAAYDVLFNKVEWRSASTKRRSIWQPQGGTQSPDGSIFIIKGSTPPPLIHQVLDGFSVYPLDFSAGISPDDIPDDWHTPDPSVAPPGGEPDS